MTYFNHNIKHLCSNMIHKSDNNFKLDNYNNKHNNNNNNNKQHMYNNYNKHYNKIKYKYHKDLDI